MRIALCLPWPPSVNHYWIHRGHRVFISVEGKNFRHAVRELCSANRVAAIPGDLLLTAEFYPPDRRRRDLDNLLKATLDALQSGGCYEDDSQIKAMVLRMAACDRKSKGFVCVEIEPIEEKTP